MVSRFFRRYNVRRMITPPTDERNCSKAIVSRATATVKQILSVPQPEQRSPEWYSMREKYLTSSDLGTVLGLNRYQTREDVLLKKTGRKENIIVDDTAIKHGQKYESEAIETYCRLTGRESFEVGLVPFAALNERTIVDGIDCSFLAGSADGITVLKTDGDRDIESYDGSLNVLEVKCPYYRWPKYGRIPEHYYPQLQMNMHILNVDVGEYIEYYPPGFQGTNAKMNIVRVYRDDLWLRHVLPDLHSFWNDVVSFRCEKNGS